MPVLASAEPNSSMSAPTQNTPGLPVKTAALQSPPSSSASTPSADSNAERPNVVGASTPLSSVTITTDPWRSRLKVVAAAICEQPYFAHDVGRACAGDDRALSRGRVARARPAAAHAAGERRLGRRALPPDGRTA